MKWAGCGSSHGTMLGLCSKKNVLLSALILEFPYKFHCFVVRLLMIACSITLEWTVSSPPGSHGLPFSLMDSNSLSTVQFCIPLGHDSSMASLKTWWSWLGALSIIKLSRLLRPTTRNGGGVNSGTGTFLNIQVARSSSWDKLLVIWSFHPSWYSLFKILSAILLQEIALLDELRGENGLPFNLNLYTPLSSKVSFCIPLGHVSCMIWRMMDASWSLPRIMLSVSESRMVMHM